MNFIKRVFYTTAIMLLLCWFIGHISFLLGLNSDSVAILIILGIAVFNNMKIKEKAKTCDYSHISLNASKNKDDRTN